MMRAPNSYSPPSHPERARGRRDVVLTRMRELGTLSAADYETRREPLRVPRRRPSPQPRRTSSTTSGTRSSSALATARRDAGASVYTTLDLRPAALRGGGRGPRARSAGERAPRLRRTRPAAASRPRSSPSTPPPARSARWWAGATTRSSQFNRAAGSPPAGLRLQAVRVPGRAAGARGRPALTAASVVDDSPITLTGRAGHLEPAQLRGSLRGPGDRAARPGAVAQRRHRPGRADVGLPAVVETARDSG